MFGYQRLTNVGQREHVINHHLLSDHVPSSITAQHNATTYFISSVHCSFYFTVALPATFKDKLKNQDKKEGETVTLCCELSKHATDVQWKKGSEILKAGEKYQMKQKDTSVELQVRDLKVEDSGEYFCVCGDQKTSATVKVNGMDS